MEKKIIRDIIEVGRFLFEAGVVDYFAGNLSIKDFKGNIYITRSGSPLPTLKPQDVIKIPPRGIPLIEALKHLVSNSEKSIPFAGKPSSEFIVHRAVYEKTEHKAVAHAHPPTVVKVAFTFVDKGLPSTKGSFKFIPEDIPIVGIYTPRDSEAKLLLGEIPIVKVEKPSASPELARAVSETLKECPCVIVYSHGVFCGGKTLKEAAGFITALEFSARVFEPDVK